MDHGSTLLSVAGAIVSVLLGGNIYFIKRIIDRIEHSRDLSRDAHKGVEGVSSILKELKSDVKALRKVEVDIAILKSMNHQRNRKSKDRDTS